MRDRRALRKGDSCFVTTRDKRKAHAHAFTTTVVSVGPKYITTAEKQRFTLQGVGDYGYRLYLSREHYLDECEAAWHRRAIADHVLRAGHDLRLATLREVVRLLGITAKEGDDA